MKVRQMHLKREHSQEATPRAKFFFFLGRGGLAVEDSFELSQGV